MKLFILMCLFLLSAVGFAQVIPDDPDLAGLIGDLFSDPKALGPLGIAMTVIVLAVQVLKHKVVDKFLKGKVAKVVKSAMVLVLGQAYTVLFLAKAGTPWTSALVTGVVASGGAMMLYNVLKPLWEKEK